MREIAKKIRRFHMTAKPVFNLNFFRFSFSVHIFSKKKVERHESISCQLKILISSKLTQKWHKSEIFPEKGATCIH